MRNLAAENSRLCNLAKWQDADWLSVVITRLPRRHPRTAPPERWRCMNRSRTLVQGSATMTQPAADRTDSLCRHTPNAAPSAGAEGAAGAHPAMNLNWRDWHRNRFSGKGAGLHVREYSDECLVSEIWLRLQMPSEAGWG